MEETRRTHDVALWGYVIMPEHVHILLYPRREMYEMRVILAALKRPVARAAHAHLVESAAQAWLRRLTVRYPDRCVFHFWQPGGGFDHNITGLRAIPSVLEYLHANPVRRELVARPTDWEYSSARFWEGCRDVPLLMDDPLVPGGRT